MEYPSELEKYKGTIEILLNPHYKNETQKLFITLYILKLNPISGDEKQTAGIPLYSQDDFVLRTIFGENDKFANSSNEEFQHYLSLASPFIKTRLFYKPTYLSLSNLGKAFVEFEIIKDNLKDELKKFLDENFKEFLKNLSICDKLIYYTIIQTLKKVIDKGYSNIDIPSRVLLESGLNNSFTERKQLISSVEEELDKLIEDKKELPRPLKLPRPLIKYAYINSKGNRSKTIYIFFQDQNLKESANELLKPYLKELGKFEEEEKILEKLILEEIERNAKKGQRTYIYALSSYINERTLGKWGIKDIKGVIDSFSKYKYTEHGSEPPLLFREGDECTIAPEKLKDVRKKIEELEKDIKRLEEEIQEMETLNKPILKEVK